MAVVCNQHGAPTLADLIFWEIVTAASELDNLTRKYILLLLQLFQSSYYSLLSLKQHFQALPIVWNVHGNENLFAKPFGYTKYVIRFSDFP